MKQEVVRKSDEIDDSEGGMVPAADHEKATAEAREIAVRLKVAEDEVCVAQYDGHMGHISELVYSQLWMTLANAFASKQVEHLKGSLTEMTAKLADSESLVASLKLSSERAGSPLDVQKVPRLTYFNYFSMDKLLNNRCIRLCLIASLPGIPFATLLVNAKLKPRTPNDVSQEEVAEARRAEKEIAERLEKALSRCAKAEDSLAQAYGDRASFENAFKDAESAREGTSRERGSRSGTPPLSKEYCDAEIQTAVTVKQYCDLERNLLRSQQDSEVARVNLSASTQRLEFLQKQLAILQQQLVDSAAEAGRATEQARQNNELASTRQEEIVTISEREQVSPYEMIFQWFCQRISGRCARQSSSFGVRQRNIYILVASPGTKVRLVRGNRTLFFLHTSLTPTMNLILGWQRL